MRVGRVLCVLAVLGAATGCGLFGDDGGDYTDRLVKYDNDRGEPNRYVNLDDGEAQLSIGSPDGHRIVVQWRDPDGSGWTAPETVWNDEKNVAIDNTVRYGGGTVGVIQTYTPDIHKDNDIGDVHVAIVCRDRECVADVSPGYVGEAQVTPDGRFAYLGQDEKKVTLWSVDRGIFTARWSGHPGFDYHRVSPSRPLLSPDGSLRIVSAEPARGSCMFVLHAAPAGTGDLDRVAASTQPLRGAARSDCRSYLDTYSADWVAVHPDDHRARDFWFEHDGEEWSVTYDDPSGLRVVDFDRGCCDSFLAGFIHWNSVAFGSPDGRRIVVQSHLLGEETWSEPVTLSGAPRGYTCTWMDGYEVGDHGYVVAMVCHSGRVRDELVGDAYALAASPDLSDWESTFVTAVGAPPQVEDDRITIGDTTWSPAGGFETS